MPANKQQSVNTAETARGKTGQQRELRPAEHRLNQIRQPTDNAHENQNHPPPHLPHAYTLTVHQPWAWLIVNGFKDLENRSWKPPAHIIGQRLYIHASKRFDTEAIGKVRRRVGIQVPYGIRMGAIVGHVRVTGCVSESDSPWFSGPLAWTLEDPVAFKVPIPCRGYQRIWKADAVLAAARETGHG